MTIQLDTREAFLDTIHGLVVRGLTFSADGERFVIVLLGGY